MSEVSEFDQMLQIAASAIEANPSPTEKAPEPAPAEQPAKVEQAAAATGDGKPAEQPALEAKAEDKPAEQTPEEKKTDWKAAAAAERAKQAARQSHKSEAVKLQQKLSELQTKMARYEALEAKKSTNPLEAAEEFGLSYDVLTREYIKTLEKNPNQSPPEVKALTQKIQQLEGEFNQQRQHLMNAQRQQAVEGFQREVKTILQTKGDEFELTNKAEEGPELVQAIVAAHWRKTAKFDQGGNLIQQGETMATEEACKRAEEYFEKQSFKRFSDTKKFKAYAKPEEKKAPDPSKQAATAPATLSQNMRQGGGETPNFSGEWEELAAMAKRLESQMGN